MTKSDFQKELKGVKPSDIKRLKRSQSADDIPFAPPLPISTPLNRSKSQEPFSDPRYPYTTLISQTSELTALKKETQAKSDTIALLRKKIESLEQQLKENPPSSLLVEQLNQKQNQVELLREQLEEANASQQETTQALDQSLFARTQSLKQFEIVHEKLKKVTSQLEITEDEATQEFIDQDQQIEQLRNQRRQFKLKIQQLERDLNLAKRLAEMRKEPLPNYSSDAAPDYLPPLIYTVLILTLTWWLSSKIKIHG